MTFSTRQRLTRWTTWEHDGFTWNVGLTWARAEGQPSKLVGFELWATPPGSDRVDAGPEESPIFAGLIPEPPSVTGRLLHDFPLRSVVGPARTEVLDLLRAAPLAEGGEIRALVECRQPRYEHGHYEAVARIYREAVANGEFPLAAINRAYPWATRGAVGQWVYRCRHTLGLLDPIS